MELWRWPAEGEDFSVRISVATVGSSGPFSKFPGIDRTIIQLSGPSMTLTHDSAPPLTLKIGVPHQFSGEVATECGVKEESEDFNVMVRRDVALARCHVVHANETGALKVASKGTCLIYAWKESACRVNFDDVTGDVAIPALHLMEINAASVGREITGLLSVKQGVSILINTTLTL